MGLPAKRRTRSSKRERASHFALSTLQLTRCGHCQRLILPHRVCAHCGWYRGREVLHLETKLEKRRKEKQDKTYQQEKEARATAKG